MTRKRTGIWAILPVVLALGAGPESPSPAQDKKQAKTYDLTWKLPHNQAAIYDHFDLKTRKKRGALWVLGCEVAKPLGVMDATDLPLRYMFRIPHKKFKEGESWKVNESAFADLTTMVGLSPVDVRW